MTQIMFVKLEQPNKAVLICQLAEEFFSSGKRILIHVLDDNQAVSLDRYMWTGEKGSFLPHAFNNGSVDCLDEPIVISVTESNPNGAKVLIMGQPCATDYIRNFDLAIDFAEVYDKPLAQQSRDRFREYRDAGFNPQMY